MCGHGKLGRLAFVGVWAAITLIARLGSAIAADSKNASTAERLVVEALRAEVAGDGIQRTALLNQAMQAEPNYAPARWQIGEIERAGRWVSVAEAQRSAAGDPRRAEYLMLRERYGESLEGQLAIARWCRRNGFDDEARFYWASILASQPGNEEAQRAIGARWHDGRLMTSAEVERSQQEAKEARQVAKQFAPRIAKWQRLLSAGDVASRDKALDEIRAISDPHAIPAIEEITLNTRLTNNSRFEQCLQVSQAFVAALDAMPGQAATKSLLRHAVFSPLDSVQKSAIAALKKRPPHDYVPLLLAGLSMPIESSFRVATDDDGSVHYWHSLYREGRDADWSFEGRFSAMQEDLQGPQRVTVFDNRRSAAEPVTEYITPAPTDPRVKAQMAAVATKNQRHFASEAAEAEAEVANANQTAISINGRITPVLAATTGENFGDNPRAWWNWWDRYNEYSSGYDRPVHEQRYADSSHTYYREPRDETYVIPTPRRTSCFAKGTPVWTNTGRRAIDTLAIGDLVLSQNADTGELAYKPIIGRTVRPPSPIVKLNVDGEELRTTLGHPLWLAGTGWQMAKELTDGAILHSVRGPVRVEKTESDGEAEAFNLVVADFSTYFVGKHGLLAHDNTPRTPTTAIVPGLER